MRLPFDQQLAKEVPEIDLIFGGHDHCVSAEVDQNTGVYVVKSGTDFEEFSDLELY
jgi:5'-nucleotidase